MGLALGLSAVFGFAGALGFAVAGLEVAGLLGADGLVDFGAADFGLLPGAAVALGLATGLAPAVPGDDGAAADVPIGVFGRGGALAAGGLGTVGVVSCAVIVVTSKSEKTPATKIW